MDDSAIPEVEVEQRPLDPGADSAQRDAGEVDPRDVVLVDLGWEPFGHPPDGKNAEASAVYPERILWTAKSVVVDVLQEPRVRRRDAVAEAYLRLPAQRRDSRDVEQLARGAVGT